MFCFIYSKISRRVKWYTCVRSAWEEQNENKTVDIDSTQALVWISWERNRTLLLKNGGRLISDTNGLNEHLDTCLSTDCNSRSDTYKCKLFERTRRKENDATPVVVISHCRTEQSDLIWHLLNDIHTYLLIYLFIQCWFSSRHFMLIKIQEQ